MEIYQGWVVRSLAAVKTVRMEKIRSQGLTTETDAEIGQMQRSISFGIMGGNISQLVSEGTVVHGTPSQRS